MIGPYISKIKLKNGEHLEFGKDDIIVFVGSNNCGKSTALNEINSLYTNSNRNTGNKVINGIELQFLGSELYIKEGIKNRTQHSTQNGQPMYSGIGFQILESSRGNFEYWKNSYGSHSGVFSEILPTSQRLQLMHPKNRKNTGTPPTEVYHIFSDNIGSKFHKLKLIFQKVFGKNLLFIPEFHDVDLVFKVSNREIQPCLSTDGDYDRSKKDYAEQVSIHQQGDGMISFCGIVANIIAGDKNIYYIDEPESFLHPPQAYILGQEISNLNSNSQLFIATHSQDFIKGLLKSDSQRVKIIKINRNGDETEFLEIDKQELNEIQSDSYLYYSNYLNSLFNYYTVVCEDSSDCIFYNRMFDLVLKEKQREDISINYVYTGGKDGFLKVYNISKKLGINATFIGDADYINNRSRIEGTFGRSETKNIKKDRKKFENRITKDGTVTKQWSDIRDSLNIIFSDTEELTKNDVKKIDKIFEEFKKPWEIFKSKGQRIFKSIPNYYKTIITFLESKGYFLVPVGEMEHFIPSIKERKGRFVNQSLKLDIDSSKFKTVKKFITKIVDQKFN